MEDEKERLEDIKENEKEKIEDARQDEKVAVERQEERRNEAEAKTDAASVYPIDDRSLEDANRGESREGFFIFSEKNKEAVHKMTFGSAEERRAGAEAWVNQFRKLSHSGDFDNKALDIDGESVNLNK